MKYKTKIVRVDGIMPMEGDTLEPGSLVKELDKGKPVGAPMRVVQIGGLDVLVNYVDPEA